MFTTVTPTGLFALAALLVALAFMLVGVQLMARARRQSRSLRTVEKTLTARVSQPAVSEDPGNRFSSLNESAAALGKRLESGGLAESLLPAEDTKLLELAGFQNIATARARYVALRFFLALTFPVMALVISLLRFGAGSWTRLGFTLLLGFAIGYMLPKWILVRRVGARKKKAGEELPLLIDLLRLMQGVGLSVDQSLQVIVKDFGTVLPVLAHELQAATALYARGRTREQSFGRLSQDFGNDDLAAICRLIEQVDRHGGAVQEPLNRFSHRIREKRRFDLKERIGRLTVKMTGVMIVTLMPALLIVTGGLGVLSVLKGLGRIAGGMS
jgi:tight adherence protein C